MLILQSENFSLFTVSIKSALVDLLLIIGAGACVWFNSKEGMIHKN